MERHIGFELRNISNLMKREITRSHGFKMDKTTGLHGLIIEYVIKNQDKDIYQKDLEEEFAMRRSTASRMLQLMEKNQLITREVMGKDARLKRIKLTDKAMQIHEHVANHMKEIELKMRKGISEEDLTIFIKVIDQIKQNLEN